MRTLDHLRPGARRAAIASFRGSLGQDPTAVGVPLTGELEGLWVARRGDHRIVYAVDEQTASVVVLAVGAG